MDMQTFDHLLNEDIKAFETSDSECDEDLDDFGDELQQLLSDDSTDYEYNSAHLKMNLNNSALELPYGTNKTEEVDDDVGESVRWKIEPNAEALEKLIDVKVANVKDPYSNLVTVENLESGESSLMKLEPLVVDFHHSVEKESFKKHLDTKAEESKLKLKSEVFGNKSLPPYRQSKRGTLGVCYKMTMNDLEETIESHKLEEADVENKGISSSESDTASDVKLKSRPRKKFKHYKEFITPKQVLYDQTVVSKLLSLSHRERLRNKRCFHLIDADTSEEDVDSLPPTDTSESDDDDDDYSETEKENISIQDEKSPSVSRAKIKKSMPSIV